MQDAKSLSNIALAGYVACFPLCVCFFNALVRFWQALFCVCLYRSASAHQSIRHAKSVM